MSLLFYAVKASGYLCFLYKLNDIIILLRKELFFCF